MKDYNLLIIEDNKDDFKKLEDRMNEISVEFESHLGIQLNVNGIRCWEVSHNSFLDFFQRERIDIVLLDYELTWLNDIQFNGIQVLDKIAENTPAPLPYIIYTSGRFNTDFNAAKSMTFAENGTKFQYHQGPKAQILDKEQSSDIITKIIPCLEKRISLNLVDYPFNLKTHSSSSDYSITALLSDVTANGKEKTPSTYLENQIIRESQIIAVLTPKNGPNGLMYIQNDKIEFDIIDFERSKLNMSTVQRIFKNDGIALVKGKTLLFNSRFIQSRILGGYVILPINGLTDKMIENFMKNKIGRELYADAEHTPFHKIFKSLRSKH